MSEQIPFIHRFEGRSRIGSAEFVEIFARYDANDDGRIAGEELDRFAADVLVAMGEVNPTATAVQSLRVDLLERYDTDHDGALHMAEAAHILPVVENFLAQFGTSAISSADLFRVWAHYDSDDSGRLELDELRGFVRDLVEPTAPLLTPQRLDHYAATLLELFDMDENGSFDVAELASLLPLAVAPTGNPTALFDYYDRDGNGTLRGPELRGLAFDLLRTRLSTPTFIELDTALAQLLALVGKTHEEGLTRDDVQSILASAD